MPGERCCDSRTSANCDGFGVIKDRFINPARMGSAMTPERQFRKCARNVASQAGAVLYAGNSTLPATSMVRLHILAIFQEHFGLKSVENAKAVSKLNELSRSCVLES